MFALDKYDFYLLILQVIPLKLLKTILFFLLFPWKQTAAVVIGFFFFPSCSKRNYTDKFCIEFLGVEVFTIAVWTWSSLWGQVTLSHQSRTAWLPGHCTTGSLGMLSLSRICTKVWKLSFSYLQHAVAPALLWWTETPVSVDMLFLAWGRGGGMCVRELHGDGVVVFLIYI